MTRSISEASKRDSPPKGWASGRRCYLRGSCLYFSRFARRCQARFVRMLKESVLTLSVLQDTFTICRLDKDAPLPDWALRGSFCSITRTAEELSIVCPQIHVPEGTRCDEGWRCLRVEGSLSLSSTGILSSLATPLAQAGISIFAMSTYDTDYLMVKEKDLERAIVVLSQEGHQVL